MKISISNKFNKQNGVILFSFEGDKSPLGYSGDKNLISEATQDGYAGKEGTYVVLHPSDQTPSRQVILAGLGSRGSFTSETLRRSAALAVKKAISLNQSTLSVVPPEVMDDLSNETRVFLEGMILADYKFDKYKTTNGHETRLKDIIVYHSKGKDDVIQKGVDTALAMADATMFVRDLVNEPPSDLTPLIAAGIAEDLAKKGKSAGVTIKVLHKKQLEEMKMGGILGVSRGSNEPPVLVHLHYKPKGAKKSVAFVGKGITFDSGGLSLKSSGNMETMKMDMGGAASILGVFKALPALKPNVEVHGIMAFSENMPGGKASKPGDVFKTMSGKTIEVLNTDAEGRLILADALAYAIKQNPDAMIDLATLTGAVIVALGSLVAGAMGNEDKLFEEINSASHEAGEMFWKLPLIKEYKDRLKSPIADVKNISSVKGEAGSIFAGLFLNEFVDHRPWIHLDIAGAAWSDTELFYLNKGGTGFPTRTLLHYLLKQ